MTSYDEWFSARRDALKAVVTPDWVLGQVKGAYLNWHYGPEPVLTATEITCGIYEDCTEERAFRQVIIPHTRKILKALTREGLLEESSTMLRGKPCIAYNATGYRNPNKVQG
jgi:hypothetical protein